MGLTAPIGTGERERHDDPARGDLLTSLVSPQTPPSRLAAACRAYPESGVPRLLDRLAYHRVDGIAWLAVRPLPAPEVDPWLRAVLRRRHERQSAATLAQGLALAEALEAMARAGVPVIVMRGIASVETIYGDAGARPFEDHDLLVPEGADHSARAALLRLGFSQESEGLFRRGGVIVDLHVDPLGARRRPMRGALFPLTSESLFRRAVPGLVAGAPAMRPDAEDDLLLLGVHVVKHSFDRLIRLADVAHLVARRGARLRWEVVRERAALSRTSRLLGWALLGARALGADVPASMLPVRPGRVESALMGRALRLAPVPFTGEALAALAAPSFASAAAFVLDALLPKDGAPARGWGRVVRLPARTASVARAAFTQSALRRRSG